MNQKGFSIIELVASFVIISIIVVGMLTIALNYRNNAQLSTQQLELTKYRDTITKAIQDNVADLEINNITTCSGNPITCLQFTFLDGTSKKLELTTNNIRYGGRNFDIADMNKMNIDFPTSMEYKTFTRGTDTVYTINIPIIHGDIVGDFGIHLVLLKTAS